MRTLPRGRWIGFVVLMCGVLVGRPLAAQSSELHPGDVARVSATAPALSRFVGRVVTVTSDSLVMQTEEPIARIAIARAAVTSTERRLPNASRAAHTVIGAGLGVLLGASVGAVAGAAGEKPCTPYSDGFCGRSLGGFSVHWVEARSASLLAPRLASPCLWSAGPRSGTFR